ncbi:MAG: MerC domain-containing protein [Opitutales bacterium]
MSKEQIRPVAGAVPKWQFALDGVAMSLAGVCGIHCLLMPVLLIAFPLWGSNFFVDLAFHKWMLIAVLPTTGLAILLGCRQHKDFLVFLLSIGGFALLCFATFGHGHDHPHPSSASTNWLTRESILTSLGGLVMVSAHLRNFLLCRYANRSDSDKSSCSCGH